MILTLERQFLDDVSLDVPWALVEAFATHAALAAGGRERRRRHLVGGLKRLGVPVTVHEPEIYLSIPLHAAVAVGGQYLPRQAALDVRSACRDGRRRRAGLSGDQPEDAALLHPRSMPRSSATAAPSVPSAGRRASIVRHATASPIPAPARCSRNGAAIGVIAVNPGIDIHWGTCTTIWGSPDLDDLPRKPKIAVVAVNNPDGKTLIDAAPRRRRSATHRAPRCRKAGSRRSSRWWTSPAPRSRTASSSCTAISIPGTSASATTPPATRRCWRSRACCGSTATSSSARVRIAWWPGHSTGRYAGSTWFADAFAIDLDENCVAQINCDSPGCRWATSYHQTTTHDRDRGRM